MSAQYDIALLLKCCVRPNGFGDIFTNERKTMCNGLTKNPFGIAKRALWKVQALVRTKSLVSIILQGRVPLMTLRANLKESYWVYSLFEPMISRLLIS